MTPRVRPFDLIFGPESLDRFAEILKPMGNRISLDTFLMSEPAITLLQELKPDEDLGEGEEYFALAHAAFRYWADGCHTVVLDDSLTRALCNSVLPHSSDPVRTRYIQIAPRLIWGSLDGGEHHEPLDGWFAVPTADGLRMVATFGLHPGRPGLSLLVAEGRLDVGAALRADGSAAFAPVLPGGDAAGLLSVVSLEELLTLGWQAVATGEHADG